MSERELLIQRTKEGMTRARMQGKAIGRQKIQLDKEVALTMLANKIPIYKVAEASTARKTRSIAALKAGKSRSSNTGTGNGERLPLLDFFLRLFL